MNVMPPAMTSPTHATESIAPSIRVRAEKDLDVLLIV